MGDSREMTDSRESGSLPAYEVPRVITYTDEEILEELGPARAGQNPGDGVFR
jgi:hypothetical protein